MTCLQVYIYHVFINIINSHVKTLWSSPGGGYEAKEIVSKSKRAVLTKFQRAQTMETSN